MDNINEGTLETLSVEVQVREAICARLVVEEVL